jgi:DNA-binding transcriptional LysR family regulator
LDVGTYILWHKDKWVSPAMAAFRDLVRSTLADDSREAQSTPALA